MSFPRYPKYKDSGIEWLGEVPEHWDVKKLKHVCNVFPSNVDKKAHEGEVSVLLCNYTDVYYNEKITSELDFMTATASAEQIKKFTLRAGDTIITKDSETADDIAVAAYVPKSLPGVVCGYHLSMVRPSASVVGSFVKRLFDSIYAKSCFAVLANGLTRVGLGQYELDNVLFPFPPRDEQSQIAAFLDRETAKIDGLVAEQRRLIELLKEKRQAVISHAVTKGLNPHAPMKPSGIEWLGDVPEHWTVMRFQRCVYVAEGQVDPEDSTYSGMPLIAPNHIESATGRLLELETADDQGAESGKYMCKLGDVVYSKIRPALRKVCIAPEDCLCSADMYPLRAHSGLTNPFLYWLILSEQFSALVVVESQRVAMPKINRESLKGVLFAVPARLEQDTVVKFLDQETAKLDALTAEAQRAIDLLQERRTALISAAVTGKIDVRGLVTTEAA